jgi:hypothetical protein
MAVLTIQQISRAGLNPALAAAGAAGDSFPNTGRVFLRVKNAHASASRQVTVESQITAGALPQGAVAADLVVSVPATQERWIGPLDPAYFNDTSNRVQIAYDTEADLTVGAFAL